MKKHWLLILGLLFVFATRVLLLNKFPIGITHDELNYFIAAKSLLWTHTFAPGTAPAIFPNKLSNFTVTIAEVPAIIFALLPSRYMGAILSVLMAWAVYLLARKLTGSRKTAYISLFLVAINPWSFLMGRTMFEVNFFVTFFLWGFYILLNNSRWKIFLALPLYLLGFFSYIGGQISFYLFIILTLVHHFFSNKQNRLHTGKYLLFAGFFSLVFIFYIFTALHNQSYLARGGELYLPTNTEIANSVNNERLLAIPSRINNLFINKVTIYARGFFEKYFNTFSPNFLFLNGETRAAFSLQKHGTMYLIDFVFLMLGLSALYSKSKRNWLFIVCAIAIGAITTGLNIVEFSYAQRAGLIYPFLIILVGVGISNLPRFRIVLGLVGIIYLISFVNMLHLYFYQFSVYASDGWFFHDRVLSRYVGLTKENVYVYTSEPKIVFEEYLYYNNLYTRKNIGSINKNLETQTYEYNNVKFSNVCPSNYKNNVVILDGRNSCNLQPVKSGALRITRLADVYEEYLIYNDKLCSEFKLNKFVPNSSYRDFEVEKQPANFFCVDWVTKL